MGIPVGIRMTVGWGRLLAWWAGDGRAANLGAAAPRAGGLDLRECVELPVFKAAVTAAVHQ